MSGNVIETVPSWFGIVAGWGKHLRDVAMIGNVIRKASSGRRVGRAPGAGTVLVQQQS